MVSIAIAARRDERRRQMPKTIASAFSLHHAAPVGGRRLHAEPEEAEQRRMNSKAKQKRRPNSATSGGSALGRISRRMIHHRPSPRSRAASTKSMHRDVDRDRAADAEDAGGVEQRA